MRRAKVRKRTSTWGVSEEIGGKEGDVMKERERFFVTL